MKFNNVSVVIPLPDHRGLAEQAIAHWLHKINFPAESFEIIVTTDGKNTPLNKSIHDKLRPSDQLITVRSANLLELVNIGVKASNSDLIFITESHCLPHKECLIELVAYFNSHDDVLACCSSDGINDSAIAEMEQMIFDEDFKIKSSPHFWNKITIRGFGILKEVFVKENGFLSQFGHFAEPALAAHLHAKGYNMGYADKVNVSHYNNPTLKYLLPGLRSYGKDMARYFIEGNSGYSSNYFKGDFARFKKVYNLPKEGLLKRYLKLHLEINKSKRVVNRKGADLSARYEAYKHLWASSIQLGEFSHILKVRASAFLRKLLN